MEWGDKYGRFVYRRVLYLIPADTREEAEARFAARIQEHDAAIALKMEEEPEKARVELVGNMR
jgi:hypothetical protein